MTERTPRTPLVVAAVTAAVFCLHLVHGLRVGAPTVPFDEIGYLGNARWLAGSPFRWEMPTSPFYAVGYPLVLAPFFAVFDSVAAQWRAVTVVNAALLAAMVPLGVAVARRVLGATTRTAIVAAGVAAVVPAAVAASPSAIAENLVLPLVLACVLALLAMLQPGQQPVRIAARLWFGVAAAALYAAHPRFTGVVAVAGLFVVVAAVRRWVPPAVAAANLATMVLAVLAVRWLSARVRADRWDHVESFGFARDVVSSARSVSGLRELFLLAWGQGWYVVVASLGLAGVGVAQWFRTARRGGPEGTTAAFVLVAAAAVFTTSVGFFALVRFRADHLIYGRHNDSFAALWVLAAVPLLLDGPVREVRRWWLTAAGVVAVGSVVLLVLRDPSSFGGVHAAFAVPGIGLFHDGDAATVWLLPSLAALAAALAVALSASSSRARHLALVAVTVLLLLSGHRAAQVTNRVEFLTYSGQEAPALLERIGIDSLAVDTTAVEVALPVLTYGWALPEVDLTTFDPGRGDRPAGDVVLARADDESFLDAGARILLFDASSLVWLRGAPEGLAVFVLPGEQQERLDRRGLLLPEGFPADLPTSARVAGLTRGSDGEVVVGSGEMVRVPVRLAHAGRGAPWPDTRQLIEERRDARVRIVARADATGPLDRAPAAVGDLSTWMLPGDATTVEVEVWANDPSGRPLPPGTHRLRLGVTQGGDDEVGDWFDETRDPVELVVRVTG